MSTPENIGAQTPPISTVTDATASVCFPAHRVINANKTTTEQAQAVLDGEHTPEQLEAAIKAQGDLVEWFHMCGKMPAAREAFAYVKVLVAMRTPETVAAMDRARGLA